MEIKTEIESIMQKLHNSIDVTSREIEILISEHDEREKERRNCMLRARLARPATQEELIMRLGALSDCLQPRREGQIPLTNAAPQYIMEAAR